jgi:hypothetical protein
MSKVAERNRQLLHFIVLPTLLLTVVLLGGLRVDAHTKQFLFLPPPLVTLLFAALLASLFLRARVLELHRWLAVDQPLLINVANLLTLLALFFASAQVFNSVLPEKGLLRWMFSFFFFWTLWTNQFAAFDPRRLLRSLIVLFGTAFVLKHLLISGLDSPAGSLLGRLTAAVLQGVSITGPGFAPVTGYVSFVALALYVVALMLVSPAPVLATTKSEPILLAEPVNSTETLDSPD